jgi:ornithine carbamoyltransferase
VAAEVADGAQSIIFEQAENRLHMHKALLLHTLC